MRINCYYKVRVKVMAILLLHILAVLPSQAQTPVEKMNEIKMSTGYIWDEYTHPDADTATVGAMRRLLLYIEVPSGQALDVEDIKPSTKFIKIKRSILYDTLG